MSLPLNDLHLPLVLLRFAHYVLAFHSNLITFCQATGCTKPSTGHVDVTFGLEVATKFLVEKEAL